ncbi:MAG: diguanylate cyclase [Woeseiaceae bacterium]|nr:diguanylate cyclase [Woeseiaceae bacterium]MDX2608116.1 diguanylate cyclase [Woeseiaceae bacterium]
MGRTDVIFELCESRGFDAASIAQRLNLVGLAGSECHAQGEALQELVIRPNADALVDSFYDSVAGIEEFRQVVSTNSDAARLKDTQKRYLLDLGVGFDTFRYFEERLRIGIVHQKIGVPQSLYQCSYQSLQCLLIQHIPQQLRSDDSAFEKMIQFILKIATLDMSLAVESYCAARTIALEKSLKNARGERERLRHLAVTDWLTELHNHSFSAQFLAEALIRAKVEGSPLCVIMADLDHFKAINDAHGHLVGDHVLRIAAARMTSAAREGDEISRYGGEEFLFILPGTDIKAGGDIAERVRQKIKSDAIQSGDEQIRVSLSLGVAEIRGFDTVDTLIARADAALYEAKRAGRDCVRLEVRE